ncbi:ATP phosphoribosyltransferase regulatory subunit [Egbenema bharatensis]|uniref:ATP phosphoribosyltransferase regulatory subunit n=1 Tax=Egbenema bharatensis TaxID=3463334 RepID=UPI003A850D95
MIYQPPVGARDLFPLDVVQKRWIEDRIQQVFHSWGYHRIITSTLERLDTLMAGGAIEQATVIQIQDSEGDTLGLRPELTASIARASVTRMAGASYPQRFYYNANVFRRAAKGTHNRQQEFYQAGIELLGADGVAADAEILLIVSACLRNLGLDQCSLILGEAGLTRSLLQPFPDHLRKQVREAIAHLDRLKLETLSLSPDLRDRALFLLDLRGQPADALQRVSSLDLDSEQRAIVNRLKGLMELLQDSFQQDATTPYGLPTITLDLSLIQTIDYYTGIVFDVIGPSGQRILGQGGRYNQLLSLYHPQGQDCPGVGFTFNIEELHQVLLTTGQLPLETPETDWLVVPTQPEAYAAAFAHAQKIRDSAHLVRVEVELSHLNDPEAVRQSAQSRRIKQIAWVDESGLSNVETIGL